MRTILKLHRNNNYSADKKTFARAWPIYSVSQKSSAPLKLFAIFSLRLNIFPWNFANLLPAYIYTCLPILIDLS